MYVCTYVYRHMSVYVFMCMHTNQPQIQNVRPPLAAGSRSMEAKLPPAHAALDDLSIAQHPGRISVSDTPIGSFEGI